MLIWTAHKKRETFEKSSKRWQLSSFPPFPIIFCDEGTKLFTTECETFEKSSKQWCLLVSLRLHIFYDEGD